MELATHYLARGLLIGSREARAVSHLKGSITILWLVILTPVASGRWTAPTQSVGSLTLPVLPRGKVSGSREGDFKEACFELSGGFVKHTLFHSQTPTLSDDSSLRGKHRGRDFDRLPVDCWCFGCFVTMRLHGPGYEGCSCGSSAIRSSKHKKRIKGVALQYINQPQLSTACDKIKQREKDSFLLRSAWRRKPEAQKSERADPAFIFYGSYTLQSTVGEVDSRWAIHSSTCVVSQRKTDVKTDLQREINNFVKWGDENSPQVLFDQVRWYTVLRKAAVFTSSRNRLNPRPYILYPCQSRGRLRSSCELRKQTSLQNVGVQNTGYITDLIIHASTGLKLQFSLHHVQHVLTQTHYCLRWLTGLTSPWLVIFN